MKTETLGDVLSVMTVTAAAAAIVWAGCGGAAPGTGHTSTEPSVATTASQSPLESLSGAPLYQGTEAPATAPQGPSEEPEQPERPLGPDYGEPGSMTDENLAPELQGTEEGQLGSSCGASGMSPEEPGYDEWLACKHQQGYGG